MIKNFKGFTKLNEQDEDTPFRLYGTGETAEAKLIEDLKGLIDFIKKANPTNAENYSQIKGEIRDRTVSITRHPSFADFKHGFDWQDSVIKLDDWRVELKDVALLLHQKAEKKGLGGISPHLDNE